MKKQSTLLISFQSSCHFNIFSKQLKKSYILILNDQEIASLKQERNDLLFPFIRSGGQINDEIAQAFVTFRKQKRILSKPVLRKLKELFKNDHYIHANVIIYDIIIDMLCEWNNQEDNVDDDGSFLL